MRLRGMLNKNEAGIRPVHILIAWAGLFAAPYILFVIFLLTRRK